jgi:hypothetical protein
MKKKIIPNFFSLECREKQNKNNELGEEFYRSKGLELLHPAVQDHVIVLSSATTNSSTTGGGSKSVESYALLRQYLESRYEQYGIPVSLMKLLPFPLHFAEEDIQYYATQWSAERKSSSTARKERVACGLFLGYPWLVPLLVSSPFKSAFPLASYPKNTTISSSAACLAQVQHTLQFTAASSSSSSASTNEEIISLPSVSWTHLMKLLQWLFPTAKVYTNVKVTYEKEFISQTNPKRSTQGWSRCMEIAKLKVLYTMHQRENEAHYQKNFQSILQKYPELGQVLPGRMESIRGKLIGIKKYPYLHDNTEVMDVWIDANAGYITMKEGPVSAERSVSTLQWIGIVDERILSNAGKVLLPLTIFHPMSSKALLVKETMTMTEKLYVQNLHAYYHLPLPGGWWYDGHFYIDFQGGMYPLRPDIDSIVEQYIIKQNAQIQQYNQLLQDFGLSQ